MPEPNTLLNPVLPYTVFYHSFIPNDPRSLAHNIILEQLAAMQRAQEDAEVHYYLISSEHNSRFDVDEYFRSLCSDCRLNLSLTGYSPEGSEMLSLQALYEYCAAHPDKTVVYLHSKGTYHPSKINDDYRRLLMKGVLQGCREMPSDCDVCSARFSPLPHSHAPGNMWKARYGTDYFIIVWLITRCAHINLLIPPIEFVERMAAVHDTDNDWRRGTGRFASEHWVHSHPYVTPCDVFPGPFVWSYELIPGKLFVCLSIHIC
jgi:hypothetical protein